MVVAAEQQCSVERSDFKCSAPNLVFFRAENSSEVAALFEGFSCVLQEQTRFLDLLWSFRTVRRLFFS